MGDITMVVDTIYNYLTIGEMDLNVLINSVLEDVYIFTTPEHPIQKGDLCVEMKNNNWCCPAKYSDKHSRFTITFPELIKCKTPKEILPNALGVREYKKMTIEQLAYHILHFSTHKERLLVDYISTHRRELLPLFSFNFSEIYNKYWEGRL
jgi:hypothetical protein